jgi:hypothetical protein
MKNIPGTRLACILVPMLPVVAFGRHTSTGPLNTEANVQIAEAYSNRGIAWPQTTSKGKYSREVFQRIGRSRIEVSGERTTFSLPENFLNVQ